MTSSSQRNEKNIYLKVVYVPFKKIMEDKVSFFLWFMFTIVAGQLGILLNVISRIYRDNMSVVESIYLDSSGGSFYTFAIALSASMLGLIFSGFVRNSKLEFTSIKVIFVTLIIFFLIFSSVIYSSVNHSGNFDFTKYRFTPDYSQIVVYLTSILLCIYGYGLLKLKLPENSDLDDPSLFHTLDDKNVSETITDSRVANDDGHGTKL